jgi:mannose-6-phosphate isomerase-like protein (cupin superfamily)
VSVGESSALLDRRPPRAVWWIDSTLEVKLTAAQTEGHIGMWLLMATRGAASPLHVHHREDEQFLVIDGRVRFVLGDQPLDARPGDLTLLPRDLPHAFVVTSERARLIGVVTPGGFESFFTDLATPVMPGAPPAAPPTIAAMTAAAPAYGLEILGPAPAPSPQL